MPELIRPKDNQEPIGKDPLGNTIRFAEADLIYVYPEQLDKVMLAIAHVMTTGDPEEWLRYVFISDLSTLSDFTTEPEDMAAISREIDLLVSPRMYIADIVTALGAKTAKVQS